MVQGLWVKSGSRAFSHRRSVAINDQSSFPFHLGKGSRGRGHGRVFREWVSSPHSGFEWACVSSFVTEPSGTRDFPDFPRCEIVRCSGLNYTESCSSGG